MVPETVLLPRATVLLVRVWLPVKVATVESIATVGVVVPVTLMPEPAVTLVTGAVPLDAAVKRPWASTVNDV